MGTEETNEIMSQYLCASNSYCEENVDSDGENQVQNTIQEEDYTSCDVVRTFNQIQVALVGDQQDYVANPETQSVHQTLTESRDEFYQSVPSSQYQHQIGRFQRAESSKQSKILSKKFSSIPDSNYHEDFLEDSKPLNSSSQSQLDCLEDTQILCLQSPGTPVTPVYQSICKDTILI